jgi:hypothetical protein
MASRIANRAVSTKGRSERAYSAVAKTTSRQRIDLISEALPFGRLSYGEPGAVNNAIG